MSRREKIDIVAVMVNGWISNNPSHIKIANKLITRDVFEFMEACDVWREHKLAKAPALFSLTREQYDLGPKMGVIHG